MTKQQDFLDQLFGSGAKTRKIGEPLRRAKLPSILDEEEDGGIDFVSDAERFKTDFGVAFSSTRRTPERNAKVGGTENSYHLKGEAADIPTAGMDRATRQKVKEHWSSLGSYDVIDEGDHIHVEPKPGVKSKTRYGEGGEGGGGSTGTPVKNKQQEFLDKLFDPNAPKPKPDFSNVRGTPKTPAKKDDKGFIVETAESVANWVKGQYGPTKDAPLGSVVPRVLREPIAKKASQVLDHVSNRFLTDIGKIGPEDPRYSPTIGTSPTLETYKARDPFIGERRIKDRAEARAKAEELAKTLPPGFWKNLKNPVDLILSDSLPANFLEWTANSYERGYDRLVEAKKVQMQENVAAHPEQYPAVSVQAAREAINARKAKQGRGVGDAWKDLKQAASEDPGRFGAELVNALMADPEMIFAPVGIGIKPIKTAQTLRGAAAATNATRVASVANRAARIADNITDAGVTGAGLNTAIEAAHAGSEGKDFTRQDATTAAVTGGAFSAIFGAFVKGKTARDNLRSGNVTQETFEQALRDVAQEDLVVDDILGQKNPIDRTVKHRIEEMAGVKFESDADLKAYLQTQRKEWKDLFKERDLNGQYQAALADERISRRQTLLEEQEARSARESAEGVKAKEIEQAYDETFAARMSRFNDDYEKAAAQRDSMADASIHQQAVAENNLREMQARLDQEDVMSAALEGDIPAVRNAMLRVAQRDAKLRVPKWQRGEVDPRIIARLGIGSLFAGTAYAVADEENKPGAALAAGLAGLIIPGAGGNVLRRMNQAGAITEDGMITGLFKGRDPAKQVEVDTALINRAKQGDQKALNELFHDNYLDIVRFANRKLKGVAGQIGMDGEDVANEVFAKAFAKIDKYESRVPYNAYLKKLAKDEVVDVFRRITAEKRGVDFASESMFNKFDSNDKTPALAGQEDGGYRSAIRGDVESASVGFDSPEFELEFMDATKRLKNIVDGLPEKQKQAFTMLNIDNLSMEEAAKAMGESYENVRQLSSRAENKITEMLEKGYGARKVEKPAAPTAPTGEFVKRGRGRPRKQTGEINQDLMKVLGPAAVGALLGAYLVDNKDAEGQVRTDPNAPSKIIGAIAGAGTGILLFGGARARASASRGAEYLYGASSTTILNKSPAIHKRILSTENAILTNTHKNLEQVDPFLVKLNKLPKEGADVLARALMTGRSDVINKILGAFNDPELTSSYKAVRATLDSLGDKLVHLKRFSKGNIEYFPRVVKDKEGLFEAIGKQEAQTIKGILEQANQASFKKNGRPLSELEESAIITQHLFTDKRSVQPGFTKNRGIEEITPKLQKYYAKPAESLHSYIRAAVQDIEGAKFFGDAARNMKRNGNEYLDVDTSVKNLLHDEIVSGKLSDEDARIVSDVLRARFKEGMRAENDTIRNIKNIGNIGLLGNFWSAATQLGDVPIQIYTQGLRPTMESIIRQVTGKKLVDMKDFGLADHISEEFAGQLRTSRWVNKVFKGTLFAGIDRFGKNTALNAAVIKAKNLAQTDSGQLKLANKYKEAYGDDFPQLISDLKAGKITDLTRDYAFMELSRTQPISRIEMPQAYLKNPNLRSYLWLKSFTMKQIDLVRREAFNEIKKGDAKSIARGVKNLTELSIVLGIAGTGTDVVKDFLHNGVAALVGGEQKEIDVKRGDLFMNIFKTYGFSQYTLDKALGVSREEARERMAAGDKYARPTKATPLDALVDGFVKPAFVDTIDSLFKGDQQKAVRLLVPGFGPYLAEQMRRAKEVEDGVGDE